MYVHNFYTLHVYTHVHVHIYWWCVVTFVTWWCHPQWGAVYPQWGPCQVPPSPSQTGSPEDAQINPPSDLCAVSAASTRVYSRGIFSQLYMYLDHDTLKAIQHNANATHPKQSFTEKNELLQMLYQLSYRGSSAGWVESHIQSNTTQCGTQNTYYVTCNEKSTCVIFVECVSDTLSVCEGQTFSSLCQIVHRSWTSSSGSTYSLR